jgi:hypothetical protein
MNLSMTLPTMLPHGRAEILEWCRLADEGPWVSLAVPERITYSSHDEPPHVSSSLWCALGPQAEERLRHYAYDYMKIFGEEVGRWAAESVACHTPDALSRAIDNARDAGADEFFLVPTTAEPEELNRIREALGI